MVNVFVITIYTCINSNHIYGIYTYILIHMYTFRDSASISEFCFPRYVWNRYKIWSLNRFLIRFQ